MNGYINEDELVRVSDTRRSATIYPFNNGTVQVSIATGTFTDTAGVPSGDTNTFTWEYDDVGPTIALRTNPEFASRSYRPDVSISMELLILNDSSLNVVKSDISFNQGSIINFEQSSSSKYQFEYVASESGVLNSIYVPKGQISDVQNTNKQASFQWYYDASPLTIESISGDVVDLSGTTNQDRIINMKLSETAFALNLLS